MFCLVTVAAHGRTTEDFAVVTPALAVVTDGAATPGAVGCSHPAAWFARQLAVLTAAALIDEPELPLPEGLARGIRAAARLHVYSCDVSSADGPSAGIAMVRVGARTVETLALGGCTAIVDAGGVEGPWVTRHADGAPVAGDPAVAQRAVTADRPVDGVRRLAVLSGGATRRAEQAVTRFLDDLDARGPGALLRWTPEARPDDATVVHASLVT